MIAWAENNQGVGNKTIPRSHTEQGGIQVLTSQNERVIADPRILSPIENPERAN